MTSTARPQLITHEDWRYRNVGIPAKSVSNVCRNVFGPSNPADTARLLNCALLAERTRAVRCLNFDIVAGKPMPKSPTQRLEWIQAKAESVPQVYTKFVSPTKTPNTKETGADTIRREKAGRYLCKSMRPIQNTPTKRPSNTPLDCERTPMKNVLRPLPMHATIKRNFQSTVLSSSSFTKLPLKSSPPSDTENNLDLHTVPSTSLRTPTQQTTPVVSRLGQPQKDLKQTKITDLMPKSKARSALTERFGQQNLGTKSRKRRSVSVDASAKKPRMTNSQ